MRKPAAATASGSSTASGAASTSASGSASLRYSASSASSAVNVLFFVLALSTATAAEETLRVREVYVPYDEFKGLIEGDPRGVVMELSEYRALLLKAIEAGRADPPPPLPPIAGSVISAHYTGSLVGHTARFEGKLRVRVAAEGWVLVGLGPVFPALGSVSVDGRPGWILTTADAENPRMQLLVRGTGEHDVRLLFSLPAVEKEDRWSIEGPISPAQGARIELDVPGGVEPQASSGNIEAVPQADRTRLVLGAGGMDRFRMEWRRRRGAGSQDLLMEAEHRVAYLIRPAQLPALQPVSPPVFVWEVSIQIYRRKTDELLLIEPPAARVLKVEGTRLHSWGRTAAGLKVRLNEPVSGSLQLRLSGIVETQDGRPQLGPPGLAGALADSGYIFLLEPRDGRLAVDSVASATELAAGETAAPGMTAEEAAPPDQGTVARTYAFSTGNARIVAGVLAHSGRFEGRATFRAEASESRLRLLGKLRVSVLEGRIYHLSLRLPAPWRLASLVEAAGGPNTARRFRVEEVGAAQDRSITILLEQALTQEWPLDLVLELDHDGFGQDRGWSRRELALLLPSLANAERTRTDLGIAIPPSMDALLADVPGWRSLTREEMASLGLERASGGPPGNAAGETQPGSLSLTAGLTTETTGLAATPPVLNFALVHRPPRLEVRSVLHLLTLERALRVRADIRLAVVDRAIEELVVGTPPSAGPSAVVLGDGVKEVDLDVATGRRTIRFARPWLGVRQLRIEYEQPLDAGTAVPVPSIEVQTTAGREGTTSERYAVLQSRGAVEVEASPGPGLSPVDIDDLPDFAEPWAQSRVLTAFRFRAAGDAGSLRTRVHDRAPILTSLAREVNLMTTISPEGVSRTRAEILLAHGREQHLAVRLPADARLLAVSVDGEPSRSVRPGPAQSASGKREYFVPLPPQSYTQIVLHYERPDPTSATGASGTGPSPAGAARLLGGWGSWSEDAPEIPNIPVGETRWTVFHPEGYRFSLEGGNLTPTSGYLRPLPGSYLGSIMERGREKKFPFLSVQDQHAASGERASLPELTPEEARGAQQGSSDGREAQNRLKPREELRGRPGGAAGAARSAAPSYRLLPEGRRLEARKLGGAARLEVAYESLEWSSFSRRTVFLATGLAGLALLLTGRRRAFWLLVAWGLFLGILPPVALDWRSPLVVVPFCEALVALAAIGALAEGWRWTANRIASRRAG